MFVLKYARSPMRDVSNEKDRHTMIDSRDRRRRGSTDKRETRSSMPEIKEQPLSPKLSQPLTIPSRNTSRGGESKLRSTRTSGSKQRRTSSRHDASAMPPAVAALLAVTAIPPRRTPKSRSEGQRTMSIDQLVQEWKCEALATSSYGSHKSMGVLLDISDPAVEDSLDSINSVESMADSPQETPTTSRSTSSDSVPSLDADNRSVTSLSDPPTPSVALGLRRSSALSPRRLKPRSLPDGEECVLNHPLVPRSTPLVDEEDASPIESPASRSSLQLPSTKSSSRKTYTSNLTLSLQSLKTCALSSLSSLSLNTAISNPDPYIFSDAQLWSHPSIFPRFSTEVRPIAFSGTPSESQRRYLNPAHLPATPPLPGVVHAHHAAHQLALEQQPLNLEDMQGHYRAALHDTSSVRGEPAGRRSPMIQMVTYTTRPSKRTRSPGKSKSSATTEAGRALLAAENAAKALEGKDGEAQVRQREPRENSDFLRVVVLEMNMRRAGKLEDGGGGRARIWLPPRRGSLSSSAEEVVGARVPRRWVGRSADDL